MAAERRRLLEILRKTSFQSKPQAVFQLASGKLSKYYIDCKQALSYPEARALVGKLIFARVKPHSIDAVGGLEIGAYPIATSVSDTIFRETGATVRAFVVRKEPKTHGVRDLIAGSVKKGDRALIVEDVVTAGGSTIKAIRGARGAGLIVERVIVLVDREEDHGRRKIEAEAVEFEALFALSDLLELPDDSGKDAAPNTRCQT